MATGISKLERHGVDALLAARSHLDPHPMPELSSRVSISYEGKLSESKILNPAPCSFVTVAKDGTKEPIEKITANSFILTDNYFGLHELLAHGVKATLFYLDPPYGTGMEFHSRALEHAYKDDMCPAAYLEYMRRRLVLMRECLDDQGSVYVHIGHQMVAHLKVVMDEIFGSRNFRNLIVRRKCSSKNFTQYQYANLNDYILFYTKTSKYKWNRPSFKPDDEWINKEYVKEDSKGRYKLVPVHAPGTRHGETGLAWRGTPPPLGKHWQYAPSKLDELDAKGEIHWSRNGNPRRKVYLTDDKMVPLTDYWDRFRDAHHQSILITGYPTEKNLDMLRTIVSASTEEGDLVVDPFCGSGTTLHAADDLGRRWIGMDQSFSAAKATITRLRHGLEPMGDYVERAANAMELRPDLFGQVPMKINDRAINANDRRVDFSFVSDAWLLKDFSSELTALGEI